MADGRNLLKYAGTFVTILATLVFLFTPARVAYGQVEEGSITGLVTDTSGAVVANALVTLLNVDQGIKLETHSDAAGNYTFSPVRIGHYTVTVTAQGFATTTQKALTVNVAQALLVNVQLKPGATTETVVVNTAPPLLQTEEASVGQVIGSKEVNDLPLNSRNFTFLAQLGAGMQTPEADTRGNAANGAFSANGLRPAQNNYLLDGIDNNSGAVDFLNGTNYIILPPVDAIQEFKVESADFSAELGRAAGAVLNATVKSGTNSIHGAAWEFFRNDKLDAADYFENNTGVRKGALRKNQFGADIGGPIIKNKVFFFGDYEGNRRVQGTIGTGNVPSNLMQTSDFQDLSDVLGFNDGTTKPDLLGRQIQKGAILDPATTRFVANGAVDPVSGLTNNSGSDGYARDAFNCPASETTVTQANCEDLNMLPADRIDANAVKLLQLFPKVTSGTQTFGSSPNLYEHSNEYDIRGDVNPSANDQLFVRFSYSNDPQYIPGIFGGIADGGAFQQGIQNAKSEQAVLGYTRVFNPQLINQFRGGYAHLVTSRYGPEATNYGLPANYGIQGIQEDSLNGGIPAFGIGGELTLGSNSFLPSDEKTAIWQANDDLTKIYGKHSFKMGVQWQQVKFSTLQPAWSHGQYDYNGQFTDLPLASNSNTTGGLAQMLLIPSTFSAGGGAYTDENDENGFDYSGGADNVFASNINTTYDERHYFAGFFQDDWKITPKLTLNLGMRYDYFTPISETNGGQANIIPFALPEYGIGAPTFIVPASGKDDRALSTGHPLTGGGESAGATCFGVGCWGLVDLLAQDGITLDVTNKYAKSLVQDQKTNLAPRFGFAYQAMDKLVVRGGFGLFYNAFENQGYGPNIGENYPFVFNPDYTPKLSPSNPSSASNGVVPTYYNTPFSGCSTNAINGNVVNAATFEAGFSCFSLTPSLYNALGLELEGMQYNFETPRTYSSNLTLQYSLTHSIAVQAAYVFTHAAHLQVNQGVFNVTQLLPAGLSTTSCSDSVKDYAVFSPAAGNTIGSCQPFPDFSNSEASSIGQSTYHGLQTKLEQQFANGLTYLFTYTWSKTMSDAGDLLNGGSTGGYRAYNIPGLGPMFDWSLANFDVRQVLHFSGGYELPFGKGKQFLNTGGVANAVLGGWATNWILTLQGGQPVNFGCPSGTASGSGCNIIKTGNPNLGIKTVNIDGGPRPFWIGNAAAFNQPCELGDSTGSLAPIAGTPTSTCLPLSGSDALGTKPGQIPGPGFHRLDFSLFKNFQFTERFSGQFRAEFYNIANHPNFNAPNFGGNGVVAIGNSGNYTDPHFGEIGGTRDAPYDPRQIQFAMKFYY